MRKFLVLGFPSTSQSAVGEPVYLGVDHAEAIGVVNEPDDKHARRELYELSRPEIRRHASSKVLARLAKAAASKVSKAAKEAAAAEAAKEAKAAKAEAAKEAEAAEAGKKAKK